MILTNIWRFWKINLKKSPRLEKVARKLTMTLNILIASMCQMAEKKKVRSIGRMPQKHGLRSKHPEVIEHLL